ncbi:MAG: hypothetical protein PUB37_07500 [Firmicutes bacterium]|nr:hypothetical protein [Bacillota bacterium]
MSDIKRCALLDTDFISKLYITKANDSDRLIYRILNIADFHFVCHQQTCIELARHNHWASKWLAETSSVTVYTDRTLIQLMARTFGAAAYGFYVDMLHRSCDIFSQTFFNTYCTSLEQYVTEAWGNYDLDDFVGLIDACDTAIGQDNNLGEIKLYTMAQILERSGTEELYLFCSDDRKARYALSDQTEMECVSALASFYLAKKYLNMVKDEAQPFFDSWMDFHKGHNQDRFQIYTASGCQLAKIPGQDIFDMLYNDELYLMKDGFFRRK